MVIDWPIAAGADRLGDAIESIGQPWKVMAPAANIGRLGVSAWLPVARHILGVVTARVGACSLPWQ